MRDEGESYKATMDHVVSEGKKAGIGLFFDMPNLPRPVTTRERVEERLALAEKRGVAENYRLYVGLTSDVGQVKEAVKIVKENKKAVGLKLYAGESTGNLGIKTDEAQEKIYRALADVKYNGVLVVHCENQEVIDANKSRYNPQEPWTWADARPEEAEYKSVKKQIEFAKKAGFAGRLRICHVSYAGTIELIRAALHDGLDIGLELAPHHLLRSTEDMKAMSIEDAKKYKCNPPIRARANQEALQDFFFNLSDADELYERVWLGSDLAPHTREEKLSDNPPSGVADFGLYSELEEEAKRRGMDDGEIVDFMHRYRYRNIIKAFKEKAM